MYESGKESRKEFSEVDDAMKHPVDILENTSGLTKHERDLLALLINKLPAIHQGVWGPVFLPLLKRLVAATAELILIEEGKIYLINREDEFFTGWHIPGGYLGPGETWQVAASRIALREMSCKVEVLGQYESYLNIDNPRNTDISTLLVCRVVGEKKPKGGKWFTEMPETLVAMQRKYWPTIASLLSEKNR